MQYIRETFGIEMKPQQFSTAKNMEKHRAKKGRRKPGPKPGKRAAESTTLGSGSHGVVAKSGGGFVEHAEAIKRAVASLGADKVKRIVGLFE